MLSFIYVALILIVIGIIYWGQIQKGNPSIYMMETYMYVSLSLLIVALTTYQLGHLKIDSRHVIISAIITFGAIFGMFQSGTPLFQHLFWLIMTITIGVMIIPIIQLTMPQIHQNVLIVITLMIILSTIALWDTSNTFSPMLKHMIIILFVLVVVELSHVLFYPESYHTWSQLYDIVVILVFCFMVLADTQNLRQRAAECGSTPCLNYPIESANIFLDIINLFTRVSSSGRNSSP